MQYLLHALPGPRRPEDAPGAEAPGADRQVVRPGDRRARGQDGLEAELEGGEGERVGRRPPAPPEGVAPAGGHQVAGLEAGPGQDRRVPEVEDPLKAELDREEQPGLPRPLRLTP